MLSVSRTSCGLLTSDCYRLLDGQICRVRHDRECNESVQPLANFDARIFEEVAYDDGAEVVRAFKIRGRLASGTVLADARVTAAEFGGMCWVASAWGARALVTAGAGARDHLRAAIQVLSEPNERLVFRHTGWRLREGHWVYLFQGGGVGAQGLTVELDPPLDRFVLPPETEDLRDAVSLSLRVLEAAPPSVSIPLLAATYAAPLAFITSPDFALWMVGPTGSLKSELAALAQRHFGTFDRKTLPGSWTSTENALEARLFTVKDAIAVTDDYAPNADSRAQQEMEKRAQRIIRGIGNRASRGRLRADLTQQPDRPPRGLVVCTGEDLPTGHSIQARLVIVEVDRERLNLPVITELQARGDRLAHAMRGYIEWLQPAIPQLKKEMPARLGRLRGELFQIGSHLRQADALAQLRGAFELLLEFAEHVGALDAARTAELRATARHTLRGMTPVDAEISMPDGDHAFVGCRLHAQVVAEALYEEALQARLLAVAPRRLALGQAGTGRVHLMDERDEIAGTRRYPAGDHVFGIDYSPRPPAFSIARHGG